MSTGHSPLAPSSAHRWQPCPGSVPLEAAYPELEESPEAAEGTAAHHAGSEELLGRPVRVGDLAPNGVVLTDDMVDGASLWVNDALTVCLEHGLPLEHLQVEQRVEMPRIYSGPVPCPDCHGIGVIPYTRGQTAESFEQGEYDCETCNATGKVSGVAYGTPDTWLYAEQAGTVYLWDFKYGHGTVEHVGNWQMICYMCGILDLLGIDGRNDQLLWCDMRIVQPRAHHRDGKVRSWRVRASDLRGYFNKLNAAAHEALSAHPHTMSGPHCLHCKAAAHCGTLKRATWSAADYLGAAVAEELDADSAGYEMQLLEHIQELVKARLRARGADLEARLKRGERVADWTLEPTYGRTTWRDGEAETVLMLGDMMGVDLRKAAAPITPLQAKQLGKKNGVDMSVIDEYSHTPRTGIKLARDTNLLNRARAGFGVKLEQ